MVTTPASLAFALVFLLLCRLHLATMLGFLAVTGLSIIAGSLILTYVPFLSSGPDDDDESIADPHCIASVAGVAVIIVNVFYCYYSSTCEYSSV